LQKLYVSGREEGEIFVRITFLSQKMMCYNENMVDKEISLAPSERIRLWRLGFAWGLLACFLGAFLILVLFLKSGSLEVAFLVFGLLGMGIICGVVVAILNSKEKKLIGAAPHSSSFGNAMGIMLIVFVLMLILTFIAFFVAAMSGLK
jgi:magnesium-transporting ATPase (P-type)